MRLIASTIEQTAPNPHKSWNHRIVLGCWAVRNPSRSTLSILRFIGQIHPFMRYLPPFFPNYSYWLLPLLRPPILRDSKRLLQSTSENASWAIGSKVPA